MKSPPPRILAFGITISSGHRRAAEAVLENWPGPARFVDALELQGPRWRAFVHDSYLSTIRARPGVWDLLYDNPRVVPMVEALGLLFHAGARARYRALLAEFEPDLLLATQAIPAALLARIRREGGHDLPILAVATDYGFHPYWFRDGIDAYCVATEEARARLLAAGAAPSAVHVTGIPVSDRIQRAAEDLPGARAEAERQWGIGPDEKVALLVGGGRGLGISPEHLAAVESSGATTVVALGGSSRELVRRFEETPRRAGVRRITAGMVPAIEPLYARADLVVTKPGGLTLAETLALGRPLALVAPLPGQEIQNLENLAPRGAARFTPTPEILSDFARRIFSDEAFALTHAAAARSAGRPDAAIRVRAVANGLLSPASAR